MDYIQTELNLGIAGIPAHTQEWRSPQYDPAWDKPREDSLSKCEPVGEQVVIDTKKSAHQQDFTAAHWVEEYWVKRGNTKYWYFRYTWMEGRKLKRKYIGAVTSALARRRKQLVEEYIQADFSPNEITTLISDFSTTTETH